MKRLYHYTCAHSIKGITSAGRPLPNPHPLLGDLALVWLTDLDVPDVYALGLTSQVIRCVRTEYRVSVDTTAVHWPVFAREVRKESERFRAGARLLESAHLARPMHWWVSLAPVPVAGLEAVA